MTERRTESVVADDATTDTGSGTGSGAGDLPARRPGPSSVSPAYGTPHDPRQPRPQQLADVLERVLDKGIVIAGDIQVNLLDIELLTIKIRLLVASVDKAEQMGIDWWKHDPMLSGKQDRLEQENRELRERLEALEARHG
ncbi:gas vesicle protein [Nocardioides sp. TF02-7]|uniref:gas vesicle protein n=1 Tax=Nocardioides sp. TF02-7 TaxID=2917724 RepID=UPI001F06D16D|nr:gas vesicle protein [Nocardioides sp. TF02-7]UMG94341.1 gas vesicle protein [Nocardioides sp. TF02-7]